MSSIAIFPCVFTDAARIIGELSYTLNRPVYTDRLLLQDLGVCKGLSADMLHDLLFRQNNDATPGAIDRNDLIGEIRTRLNTLLSGEDMVYYGFLTLLLTSPQVRKVLITASDTCRIQRALQQDGLSKEKAREIMAAQDQLASNWAHTILGLPPYEEDLYDTVIRYECQDLMDVVAYLFMLYQEQEQQIPVYRPGESGSSPSHYS